MKTIFILADSLNRRFLNCYGAEEKAITPNIDRLAEKSMIFDNHWCGSAPCMPARRDILTGRLNFLDRPWGGIEPFDHTLPMLLKENNVYTHMETDHFHYAERGGENYWGHFTSWNLHRGTEHDTIFWGPDRGGIPKQEKPSDFTGIYSPSYETTKGILGENKENYSTPRTFNAAAKWIDANHEADNFMLWVEGFDPHEPFDVPKEYLELYEGENPGPGDPYWPDYTTADHYTPEQIQYFRKRYKALVTMTDEYLGKILDAIDKHDLWKDTMVILTTDHGYLLGEHGFMAKNYMPDYNEIHHIPMLIAAPGVSAGRCGALTENIDMFPTMLETYGVPLSNCRNKIHGKSLYPLLKREQDKVRNQIIFGIFGKTVNMFDGRYLYMRSKAQPENEPLNIYGSMMAVLNNYIGLDTMQKEDIDRIETGRYLSWTNYPVYKVPAQYCHWTGNSLAFHSINNFVPGNLLFDLSQDYQQENPIKDEGLEAECIEKLRRCMVEHDSPEDQFVRLGLEVPELITRL
ncbi:MAG: sulfatase [Bacillota bacterium]|jgi:arylsulfatase A-like enzyme|nr:sulfatase [Bacillota bacterium]